MSKQPKDYPTRTIENTEVCPCGNIFVEDDDYDTLGSEGGVCCPNCGNEKFQTVKDRLDRAESINADLLKVCEAVQDWLDTSSLQKVLVHCTNAKEKDALIMGVASHLERIEATIEKAKKD